jgi:hypothetical protein
MKLHAKYAGALDAMWFSIFYFENAFVQTRKWRFVVLLVFECEERDRHAIENRNLFPRNRGYFDVSFG